MNSKVSLTQETIYSSYNNQKELNPAIKGTSQKQRKRNIMGQCNKEDNIDMGAQCSMGKKSKYHQLVINIISHQLLTHAD